MRESGGVDPNSACLTEHRKTLHGHSHSSLLLLTGKGKHETVTVSPEEHSKDDQNGIRKNGQTDSFLIYHLGNPPVPFSQE